VGPRSTLPVPRVGAFALGMVKTGPIPQIRGPGCVAEKNNSSVTSPMPLVLLSNSGLGWLINGAMCARQVPVIVYVQRHDRRNVEYFLGAIERPSVEIGVALERHADEVATLLQVFVFRGGRVNAGLELIVDTDLDHLNVAVQATREP
jgi:hypothetical protein